MRSGYGIELAEFRRAAGARCTEQAIKIPGSRRRVLRGDREPFDCADELPGDDRRVLDRIRARLEERGLTWTALPARLGTDSPRLGCPVRIGDDDLAWQAAPERKADPTGPLYREDDYAGHRGRRRQLLQSNGWVAPHGRTA